MITDRKPNRLVHEKSPYLFQHAYNPVNWYPWGEEAFRRAREEDKPIFISIGYSTCHWCHVMERESFEDEEVAEALNQDFICIKVDKEERPDIDAIYMSACQAFTGQGGWPLTIFTTPEQKPFFAGTYYPKNSRYGLPGLLELLQIVSEKWKNDKEALIHSGDEVSRLLSQEEEGKASTKLSKEWIFAAKSAFARSFDREYGGFGNSPKFPTPHNLMFLMRYAYYEKDSSALDMVEKTLDQMARGGIFDHIGYGFSRYSTDKKWLVPHFEKMLYDNALLIICYLQAYQITGNDRYKKVAENTIRYVERELTDRDGGFYCAQDADSEGEEGKYYVFTPQEIIEVLGETAGQAFNDYYDITAKGNFEGQNIPNRIHPHKSSADNEELEQSRKKLYEYRLTRTRLHKDDKILTSWNALMIVALATAYRILDDPSYLTNANRALTFLEKYLTDGEGRLYIRYRDNESVGKGNLDDYAFLIWACCELYDATFDVAYLKKALDLTESMNNLFLDEEKGGYFLYGKDAEQLIHRPKEVYDGAIPSGNAVAAYVLLRLARLTGRVDLEASANRQLNFLIGRTAEYPMGNSFAMIALQQALYPSSEIVCVVQKPEDLKKFRAAALQKFLPDTLFLVKQDDELETIAPFIKEYTVKNNQMSFYMCQNKACSAPFNGLDELKKHLG